MGQIQSKIADLRSFAVSDGVLLFWCICRLGPVHGERACKSQTMATHDGTTDGWRRSELFQLDCSLLVAEGTRDG